MAADRRTSKIIYAIIVIALIFSVLHYERPFDSPGFNSARGDNFQSGSVATADGYSIHARSEDSPDDSNDDSIDTLLAFDGVMLFFGGFFLGSHRTQFGNPD